MEQQKSQIKTSPYVWRGLANKKEFKTAEDFQNGDTRAVQQFLVDEGYLNRTASNGKTNIDGKRGPTTNAAIQAYLKDHPIKEPTTNNFVKAFNNKWNNVVQKVYDWTGIHSADNTEVTVSGKHLKAAPGKILGKALDNTGQLTEQCAQWANDQHRSAGRELYGNAWNQTGSRILASGYSKNHRDVNIDDVNDLHLYNLEAAERFAQSGFDFSKLDPSKSYIAHMYYNTRTGKPSPATQEAHRNGLNGITSTHVGVLKNVDGNWVVEHNIHGNVYRNNASDLMGTNYQYGLTAIRGFRKGGIIARVI